MKKRILTSVLTASAYGLALLLTLIACRASGGGDYSFSPPPSGGGSSSSGITSSGGAASSGGGTSSSHPAAPGPQAQDPALTAYQKALEGIFNDHRYPNGDPLETFQMENNDFAVFDVDGDGDMELLYQNDDTVMAGMTTNIYSFAPETGALYLELSDFCGMTFYDNGVITVAASHNQGLSPGAEDFWPYALYQYDPGSDGYLMAGGVDAWDRDSFPEDFGGSPFPAELDKDGDGMVYLVTYPGQEITTVTMDGPEYQQWLDGYLDGAAQLEIPWQAMTLENIHGSTELSFPF